MPFSANNPCRLHGVKMSGRALKDLNVSQSADAEYIDSENLLNLPDVDAALSTLAKRLESKDWVRTCEALNNERQLAMYHKELLRELQKPLIPLTAGGVWVHERYAYMNHKDPIR